MLKWALIFFTISLLAGFFGFGNVASGSRRIAKLIFYFAIGVFALVLLFGVLLGVAVF